MSGGPDTGRPGIPTGSGFPQDIAGRHVAISLRTVTGTIHWNDAVCCLPHGISAGRSLLDRGSSLLHELSLHPTCCHSTSGFGRDSSTITSATTMVRRS